jgi:DsbC/DsbD-like thiol-disulfide interchange protein
MITCKRVSHFAADIVMWNEKRNPFPMIRRLVLTVLVLLVPAISLAKDGRPVHLSVLNGWTQEDGKVMAAIRLDLEEGWKTYWRAPGEGGIPPTLDLRRSRNLQGFAIEWPAPDVFEISGLRSIGYSDSVVFPLDLVPFDPARDVTLRGEIDLGVCKDICLPVTLRINGKLPVRQRGPNPEIAAALAARPIAGDKARLRKVTCTLTPADGGMILTADITMPSAGDPEIAVIESDDPDHWLTATENSRTGDTLTSTSFLASISGQTLMLDRSGLRFTVLGSDYAVDIQGCSGG